MRILITGVTGFVGGHLAELLLREGGHVIHGLSRHAVWPGELTHLNQAIVLHAVDLAAADAIQRYLGDFRPEWIFHLAGYANTGGSFHEPAKAWAGNLHATLNLYTAAATSGTRPRIVHASTGLVYGNPTDGDRVCTEDDAFYPASPYAASKAAADLLGFQMSRHPGLDVVRVRCFNQIGPRQAPDYAVANFARQTALIEAGRQAPILETGGLSGLRDLTDVRDMVRAFRALAEQGRTGEAYNAGSGTAVRMRDVLNRLLAQSKAVVEVREKTDPNRRADLAVARADLRKIRAATGWEPAWSLDQSLADILDYWRKRTAAPARAAG